VDFNNQFMWIDMKLFSFIFWGLGVLILIGEIGGGASLIGLSFIIYFQK